MNKSEFCCKVLHAQFVSSPTSEGVCPGEDSCWECGGGHCPLLFFSAPPLPHPADSSSLLSVLSVCPGGAAAESSPSLTNCLHLWTHCREERWLHLFFSSVCLFSDYTRVVQHDSQFKIIFSYQTNCPSRPPFLSQNLFIIGFLQQINDLNNKWVSIWDDLRLRTRQILLLFKHLFLKLES